MVLITKYDIGEKVWSMEEAHTFGKLEPLEGEIEEIQYSKKDGIVYKMKKSRHNFREPFLKEKLAFATKELLLQSLVKQPA